MELDGKIWKNKQFWLVEVPALDIMTQGNTREEALKMIKDAIRGMIACYFSDQVDENFEIAVIDYKHKTIGVTSSDNSLMLALSLRRQREMSGSTVREASERLGSSSPNAYAKYERGKIKVSLDQYERLLQAANPYKHPRLRVV